MTTPVIIYQSNQIALATITICIAANILLLGLHTGRHYQRSRNHLRMRPGSRLKLPLLLILWICLIGFAIPEAYTFEARTTASDYVLPLLIFVVAWATRRQTTPPVSPCAAPWMVLYLLWAAIALLHGTLRAGYMTPAVVLSSLTGIILGYALIWIIYNTVDTIDGVAQALMIFVLSGSIWNGIGLFLHLSMGGNSRMVGTLINPNAFAMYISIVWICQLAMLLQPRLPGRLLFMLNLLLLSISLLFSGSRGAWIGCVMTLPAMIVLFSNRQSRMRLLALLGIVILAAAVLVPVFAEHELLAPAQERLDLDRGLTSRVVTDTFVLSMWMSSPVTMIFGTGTGVYSLVHAYFNDHAANSIHNIYTLYLVEQGPIGVVAWFSVFIIALLGLWQARHSIPAAQQWIISACFFSIVSLLVQGASHDTSNQRHLWMLVGLAFVISDYALKRGRFRQDSVPGINYYHSIDRTYAVVDLAGICRNKRPDSPPAGWKIPFFFTKILHKVQNFCEKEKEYHAAAGDSAVHRVKRPV
jgi:O-antigen ligase